jgi:hypothetical protein
VVAIGVRALRRESGRNHEFRTGVQHQQEMGGEEEDYPSLMELIPFFLLTCKVLYIGDCY